MTSVFYDIRYVSRMYLNMRGLSFGKRADLLSADSDLLEPPTSDPSPLPVIS